MTLPINLRVAASTDWAFLFRLRNDPLTRAMSANSLPTSLDKHLEWLDSVIYSHFPPYIAQITNTPVGVVRADSNDELSWTVAPEYRNQGIARLMLKEFIFHSSGIKYHARIKQANRPSIRLAESLNIPFIFVS